MFGLRVLALWITKMKGFVELEESYPFDLLEEKTTLNDVIDNHIREHTLEQTERNAFFVADLGNVVKKNIRWKNVMTHVKPFYTVKCNSSQSVIEVLAALGTGFACANKNEITLVQSLGVHLKISSTQTHASKYPRLSMQPKRE